MVNCRREGKKGLGFWLVANTNTTRQSFLRLAVVVAFTLGARNTGTALLCLLAAGCYGGADNKKNSALAISVMCSCRLAPCLVAISLQALSHAVPNRRLIHFLTFGYEGFVRLGVI